MKYAVGIALGSNQGDRLRHLQAALDWLKTISLTPIRYSRVYETAPVECPEGSLPFLNAVCEITFEGDLLKLLSQMRAFEQQEGRPLHYPKNAPRPLDLDLLYAGDLVLESDVLTLPHPRMLQRRFVLQPLSDIRPDLVLPQQTKNVQQHLTELKDPSQVALFAGMLNT